jgi:hypothetical protein
MGGYLVEYYSYHTVCTNGRMWRHRYQIVLNNFHLHFVISLYFFTFQMDIKRKNAINIHLMAYKKIVCLKLSTLENPTFTFALTHIYKVHTFQCKHIFIYDQVIKYGLIITLSNFHVTDMWKVVRFIRLMHTRLFAG